MIEAPQLFGDRDKLRASRIGGSYLAAGSAKMAERLNATTRRGWLQGGVVMDEQIDRYIATMTTDLDGIALLRAMIGRSTGEERQRQQDCR